MQKNVSIANGGIYQVQQHQQGSKHAKLVQECASQPKLFVADGNVNMDTGRSVIILSQQDQIARAEVLFLCRLVKHDQSFSSCDDLVPLLKSAFSDPVAKSMTLGATKASYGITYGLGPYFHDQLVADVKKCWYSLLVDETTTEQNIKQFDLHVRYWSGSEGGIVTGY